MRRLGALAAVLLVALAFSPPTVALVESPRQLGERPALLAPLWQLLAPLRAFLDPEEEPQKERVPHASTAAAQGEEEEPAPVDPQVRGMMDPDG